MCRRADGVYRWPSKSSSPEVQLPERSRLTRVVLPAPDGPSTPQKSPAGSCSDTSCRMSTLPLLSQPVLTEWLTPRAVSSAPPSKDV